MTKRKPAPPFTVRERPKWDTIHAGGESIKYTCGYCGNRISSNEITSGTVQLIDITQTLWGLPVRICICHDCGSPTYFDWNNTQYPGCAAGNDVPHIENEQVSAIYNEARECMRVNAYTGVVLCCRKLVMNVAVAKGANENLRFIQYVDHLEENNLLPQGSVEWVDHIRKVGNMATHEIPQPQKEDAEELLTFSEMLLRIIYEFPARMRSKR